MTEVGPPIKVRGQIPSKPDGWKRARKVGSKKLLREVKPMPMVRGQSLWLEVQHNDIVILHYLWLAKHHDIVTFKVGDLVSVRNKKSQRWKTGTVVTIGPPIKGPESLEDD